MDFERNLFPVLMINALAYEQPKARERSCKFKMRDDNSTRVYGLEF